MQDTSTTTQENLTTDFTNRTEPNLRNTSDEVTQTLEKATDWIQQNYGRTLSVVGVLVAAGLVGYLIGRNHSSPELQRQQLRH